MQSIKTFKICEDANIFAALYGHLIFVKGLSLARTTQAELIQEAFNTRHDTQQGLTTQHNISNN